MKQYLSYQSVGFGQFQNLTVDPKLSMRMMTLFEKYNFLFVPTVEYTLPEMKPNDRFNLVNSDTGLEVRFGLNRIEVIQNIIFKNAKDNDLYMPKIDEFIKKVMEIYDILFETMGIKINRVSLIVRYINTEVNATDYFKNMVKIPTSYSSSNISECNFTIMKQEKLDTIGEQVNIGTQMIKTGGDISNQKTGQIYQFEGLLYFIDINTLQENFSYNRINKQFLAKFFNTANDYQKNMINEYEKGSINEK
jgi:hypothetical protein